MKKTLIIMGLSSVLGCSLFLSLNVKTARAVNITQTNIAMLTASAETEGTESLTGPRKEKTCGYTEAYHKMVCYCENTIVCTDSDCY
jgi:hypothetical protein